MKKVDVIVIGSGFAGSMMAMILRRLGKTVAMIEKGRHPRFAIGESSTPLANLLLEEIARKYDLPDLAAFSKWGTWQAAHPEIACGLKRGFTFYKHAFGSAVDFADRAQQLLVAASPHDRIADTHWYRPEFDAHLARRAAELGAELLEGAVVRGVVGGDGRGGSDCWRIEGRGDGGEFLFEADFLVDASGPRGFLFRHFGWEESRAGFVENFPETSALFAHFRGVKRLDETGSPGEAPGGTGGAPVLPSALPPFPVDDAAVHHVLDGGWIWVLRFNNGITSAGASLTKPLAEEIRASEGAAAWDRLLEKLPTVRAEFAGAKAGTEFYYQPTVAFRSPRVAGGSAGSAGWALLPSAAGFVDPLFSTGFVLTLSGIWRLGELFERDSVNDETLAEYERVTLAELDQTGELVAAAFRAFGDFPKFVAVAKVYFAAAIWSETLRRLGRKAPAFLLAADVEFSRMIRGLRGERAEGGTAHPTCAHVEKIDLAGLIDPSRQNWHPALATDLFASAWKIPATREEIETMLRRCGF